MKTDDRMLPRTQCNVFNTAVCLFKDIATTPSHTQSRTPRSTIWLGALARADLAYNTTTLHGRENRPHRGSSSMMMGARLQTLCVLARFARSHPGGRATISFVPERPRGIRAKKKDIKAAARKALVATKKADTKRFDLLQHHQR